MANEKKIVSPKKKFRDKKSNWHTIEEAKSQDRSIKREQVKGKKVEIGDQSGLNGHVVHPILER